MILFLKDWQRYTTATVHKETRNTSFLQMAKKLQMMGVKNYYFHLALLNPELRYVDPHDPNLTLDQKMMIQWECRFNPWYFFREVARVPPNSGDDAGPILANRGNLAAWWLFFNHIMFCLIQPRQTGKSLSADMLVVFLLMIGMSKSRINLLTKDDILRSRNIERLKDIIYYLPPYLNFTTKGDADNQQTITVKELGNQFTAMVSQNNPRAANKIGRGLTAVVNIFDESPFVEYMEIVLGAMLKSGLAARKEAERKGGYYGTIFTTTVGKKDEDSGAFTYRIFDNGMFWSEILYDNTDWEALKEMVRVGSPSRKMPMVNITMSHTQLGYDDAWMVEALASSTTEDDANRDLFNVWTSGTGGHPLKTALLEAIRKAEREPEYVEISKEGYIFNWYIRKEKLADRMATGRFVMGMDTSEAVERDAITMVVIDVKTLEVVGASACNETNLAAYAKYVTDFMVKYDTIVAIPECKSTGTMFVDTLLLNLPLHGVDPFKRIYNRIVDESEDFEEEYKLIQTPVRQRPTWVNDKYKKFFGFKTSGGNSAKFNRDTLFSDVLHTAAKRGGKRMSDKRLIGELLQLKTKNGRIDHTAKNHDDSVIAWLIAIWMLMMTKNLKYYGIEETMSSTDDFGSETNHDPYQKFVVQQQNMLKAKTTALLDRLKTATSELEVMQLENDIRLLDSMLMESGGEAATISALIKEARDKRVKSMRAGGGTAVKAQTFDINNMFYRRR